jgi:hypothetical protein
MIFYSKFKLIVAHVLCVATLLPLSGCSISNSVGSTSDSAGSMAKSSESISGSSASSSKSSEKDAAIKNTHYENETQEFTVSYLRANPDQTDQNSFMKGISAVATRHGIVDWEANPHTYHAIGKGLKNVNITKNQLNNYKQAFTYGDNAKMTAVQQGYEH